MNRLIDFSSRFRILKGGKISLVVSALLAGTTISYAAPSDGTVVSGSATISQSGTVTNINQSTQKASINWQNFSIAQNETVNFNQPNASSITLNRVIGNERSVIDGALNANGQVWLLNSNGVLFGKNASINTAGLLATTAKLSDEDFQAGNYNFTDATANSVINEGTITISDSGSVILASNEVRNSGTIQAVKGKVHLVGADSYSLNLNGNSLVNLKVEKGVLDALVENSGHIIADGGEVYLTTNAVDELLKGVVNHTGIIEANSLDGLTGKVELFAHGGEAQVGGTIEAKGGFVETSGKDLSVKSTAQIKTAHWLLDPESIIISNDGEDVVNGIVNASVLETALASGDVTLAVDTGTQAGEDITINADLSWDANTLTLNAYDIYINAVVDVTNTAGLTINKNGNIYANFDTDDTFKGKVNLASTASLTIDAQAYTIINTFADLTTEFSEVEGLFGHFALGNDIDQSGGASYTTLVNDLNPFIGKFNGLGHTINNYTNDSSFFIMTDGAQISNLALTNANVTPAAGDSGILIGAAYDSSIFNVYSTGIINGTSYDSIGGLVGLLAIDDGSSSIIKNSYSTATVSGDSRIGGLVGEIDGGHVYNSYATGTISGADKNIGGLVGVAWGTVDVTIENSYSTGSVTGVENVGGLVGWTDSSILNSYALGDVDGDENVGGLAGRVSNPGSTINFTYSKGFITGNTLVGGLIGENDGDAVSVSSSFWDTTMSGQATSAGGVGKTTSQMRDEALYVGWNTATIWSFPDPGRGEAVAGYEIGGGAPYLTQITRDEYKNWETTTLFEGGWGGLTGVEQAGADGSAYTIRDANQLQNIGVVANQNYDFEILRNIDLANFVWNPIGNFDGNLNGNGFVIENLTIAGDADTVDAAFFEGILSDGVVSNLRFANANILAEVINPTNLQTAAVLASQNEGTIEYVDVYTNYAGYGDSQVGNLTLDVNSIGGLVAKNFGVLNGVRTNGVKIYANETAGAGGLVGVQTGGTIYDGLSSAVINIGRSSENVGGLVGLADNNTDISLSWFAGSISALSSNNVGGLVGFLNRSTLETSFSFEAGDISGHDYVGGAVGNSYLSHIEQTYATKDVVGNDYVGGLVGYADHTEPGGGGEGTILNSYATGDVTGANSVGGLVGEVVNDTVINSYAIGDVTGTNSIGGLIGEITDDVGNGLVTNSLWDMDTTGITDGLGQGRGFAHHTTGDYGMDKFSTYDDYSWDIVADDTLDPSYVYPVLSLFNGGGVTVWKIYGTAAAPAPVPVPQPESEDSDIEDIITPILNGTRIVVNVPQLRVPQTPNQAPRVQTQTTMTTNMGLGNNARIVSTTTAGENPNRVVSLGELQQANGGAGEVRVPLGENSIVDLVNGGVNLPAGVEQQFFVVANEDN